MPDDTRKIKKLSEKMRSLQEILDEDNYKIEEPMEKELTKGLTRKQIRFCQEYIKDLNKDRAYRKAGYNGQGLSVSVASTRLLKNVKIKRYVDWLQRRKRIRNEITADNVLKELGRLGFSNLNDFAEWTNASVTLKASTSLGRHHTAAIKSIRTRETNHGTEVNIMLHDKVSALRLIGEHLRLFADIPGAGDEEIRDKAVKIKEEADRLFNSIPIAIDQDG